MTKQTLIIISTLALLLVSACKKVDRDVHNYIPRVETVSATPQPDGTVLVKGVIISSGNTPTYFAGFCMDTIPLPCMLTNQVAASVIVGDTFSCSYGPFPSFQKYYFRAWAANAENYAIGKAVSADSITFDTSGIGCHLAPGYLAYSGPFNIPDHFTHFDPLVQSADAYTCWAYTDNHSISVSFSGIPVSGVYTTNALSSHGVQILFDGVAAKDGATVYVRQASPGSLEITICSVQVFINYSFSNPGDWFSMAARFTVTY